MIAPFPGSSRVRAQTGVTDRGFASTDSDESESPARKTSRSQRTTTTNGRNSGEMDGDMEESPAKKKVASRKQTRRQIWSNNVAESKYFVWFTTVLTIWALTGDDLRLICFQRPADEFFNAVVIISMLVFIFEIMISWMGKSDYPRSFFFILDVIATGSMLLDITWVADGSLWTDNSESDNASNLRGGKSAKIGAKVARIVRVVRLVRIVKLYKAYYDRKSALRRQRERERREREGRAPGEFDDWDEEDFKDTDDVHRAEGSQIGKKLSDMTIRILIILILTMLLGLPFLVQEESTQVPFSADYGADQVWQAFQAFDQAQGTSERTVYEESLLNYIYYHNWFAKEDKKYNAGDSSAKAYYSQLYWVGMMGLNSQKVVDKTESASVRQSTLLAWNSQVRPDAVYAYGSMPEKAQEILHSEWSTQCDVGQWSRRGISLLSQSIDGVLAHTVRCPEDLRPQESLRYQPRRLTESQYDEYRLVFYFDLREFVREESWMGLATTLFVLVLLISGSLWFSHSTNYLLVRPLENMMMRVKEIRDKPLNALRMSDEEFKAEQIALAKKHQRTGIVERLLHEIKECRCMGSPPELMETVILEKTIIKLGGLLVLGFGEAGANIISFNMKSGSSVGVDPMVPGATVECIIGVARIRDFSIATEVLQSKIMKFVNQVAEIVHGVGHEFHGAPNKNSGEKFLLVWRMDADRGSRSRLADMSVVAFTKMLAALHRSPVLAGYRKHPGLQLHLGENSQVNMSFGLHAGWAIEGAVGSEFKIDASYVSPNVSLAHTMESATRTYGVSFVLGNSVVEHCSHAMAAKFRLIDRVQMVGSKTPIELYCVDLDYRSVRVDHSKKLNIQWNTRSRFKVRQFLETEKNAKLGASYDPVSAFDADPNITIMRQRYKVEFFQLFSMGYQNYKEGEWQVARKMLCATCAILSQDDGPSSALLHFMEKPHMFDAPKDWKGIREFDKPSTA